MAIILGQPASNLDNTHFTSRSILSVGALGERKTARKLEEWGQRHKTAVIAHSLSLPGAGNGDTDHIVAIGNNVLLVDSKRWKSGYTYGVTKDFKVRRAQGMSEPKGRGFKAGDVHTVAHIEKWKKELGNEFQVAGMVVIAANVRVHYEENWAKCPFKLVAIRDIEKMLDLLFDGVESTPNRELIKKLSTRLI